LNISQLILVEPVRGSSWNSQNVSLSRKCRSKKNRRIRLSPVELRLSRSLAIYQEKCNREPFLKNLVQKVQQVPWRASWSRCHTREPRGITLCHSRTELAASLRPRGASGASERSDEDEAERREKQPEGWTDRGRECRESVTHSCRYRGRAPPRSLSRRERLHGRSISRWCALAHISTFVARFGDKRR